MLHKRLSKTFFMLASLAVILAMFGWAVQDFWLASTQWMQISVVLLLMAIYIKMSEADDVAGRRAVWGVLRGDRVCGAGVADRGGGRLGRSEHRIVLASVGCVDCGGKRPESVGAGVGRIQCGLVHGRVVRAFDGGRAVRGGFSAALLGECGIGVGVDGTSADYV